MKQKNRIRIGKEIAEIRELVKKLENQLENARRDMQKYKEKLDAPEAAQSDAPEQFEYSLKPENKNNRTKGEELTR